MLLALLVVLLLVVVLILPLTTVLLPGLVVYAASFVVLALALGVLVSTPPVLARFDVVYTRYLSGAVWLLCKTFSRALGNPSGITQAGLA
jgi:hypothetical protein